MLAALLVGCETCDVREAYGEGAIQEELDRAGSGATITVCAGEYRGLVEITEDVTLSRSSTEAVWLDGGGAGPVIRIIDAVVTLDGLGIRDGAADADGRSGGLWIQSDEGLVDPWVELIDVVVRGNDGGGVGLNGGHLEARGSEITGNTGERGGALRVITGDVVLVNTTVEDNEAEDGGAFYVDDGGEISTWEGSVCRNTATRGGGAWLVTGEGEEAPGALSSIGTDWCEGEDDNTPDDVATETTSYDYGDAADFTVSG